MSTEQLEAVKALKTVKSDKTTIKSAYSNPKFVEEYPNGLELPFEYDEYSTDEAAAATLKTGELADLVNAREKSNARSAAIAKATLPYKPAQDDPAEIRKRMIKDAMQHNKKLTEEQAAAKVDRLLASLSAD